MAAEPDAAAKVGLHFHACASGSMAVSHRGRVSYLAPGAAEAVFLGEGPHRPSNQGYSVDILRIASRVGEKFEYVLVGNQGLRSLRIFQVELGSENEFVGSKPLNVPAELQGTKSFCSAVLTSVTDAQHVLRIVTHLNSKQPKYFQVAVSGDEVTAHLLDLLPNARSLQYEVACVIDEMGEFVVSKLEGEGIDSHRTQIFQLTEGQDGSDPKFIKVAKDTRDAAFLASAQKTADDFLSQRRLRPAKEMHPLVRKVHTTDGNGVPTSSLGESHFDSQASSDSFLLVPSVFGTYAQEDEPFSLQVVREEPWSSSHVRTVKNARKRNASSRGFTADKEQKVDCDDCVVLDLLLRMLPPGDNETLFDKSVNLVVPILHAFFELVEAGIVVERGTLERMKTSVDRVNWDMAKWGARTNVYAPFAIAYCRLSASLYARAHSAQSQLPRETSIREIIERGELHLTMQALLRAMAHSQDSRVIGTASDLWAWLTKAAMDFLSANS